MSTHSAPLTPCPFEDEVLLLADGEMDFTRRIVVEAHLGVCESCAEIEDALALAQDCIVAEPIEPLGAAERALATLPQQGPRLRPLVLAAAAAALVFVAVRTRLDRPEPAAPPVVAHEDPSEADPTETDPPEPGRSEVGELTTSPESAEHTAALPPLPTLPPPQPPVGPTLRRRLAEIDPLAADRDEQAAAIAHEVRRRGTRGARALAQVLGEDDELMLGVALSVTHTRFGDVATAQLAERQDESAVPALIEQLESSRSATARDALASIGGRRAARALVRTFWVAPPAERRALLAAAVSADAATGGVACLEAAATPRDDEAEGPAFDAVARAVVSARPEQLLPYLRRAAAGRDALRARVAARALGWAADETSVPDLRAMARSPRTASAAVAALLDIGSRDALDGAFEAALLSGRDGAVAAAFQDRHAAETFLLERLRTGDLREQRFALALLSRCGGPRSALALADARIPRKLQDELITTLGAIGGDEAATALGALTEVTGLESAVIAALGRTGSALAVPHLERIATTDARRRSVVVAALAAIESAESAGALIALLADARAGPEALDAVAAMPVGLVVPGLLERCDESVPLHVRRALARIAGRDLGSSPRPWREWWATHT
jgi:hypothetical protein